MYSTHANCEGFYKSSAQQLCTGLSVQLTIHLPARQKDFRTLSLKCASMFILLQRTFSSILFNLCRASQSLTQTPRSSSRNGHPLQSSIAWLHYQSLLLIICALTFHDGLPPFVWWCTHTIYCFYAVIHTSKTNRGWHIFPDILPIAIHKYQFANTNMCPFEP